MPPHEPPPSPRWSEAHAEIFRGEPVIVIRVPFSVLPDALEQNPRDGSYVGGKVTSVQGFANEVVRELNAEAEDGTTPIHELFDRAMAAAIENGSEWYEFPERDTPKPDDSKPAEKG